MLLVFFVRFWVLFLPAHSQFITVGHEELFEYQEKMITTRERGLNKAKKMDYQRVFTCTDGLFITK